MKPIPVIWQSYREQTPTRGGYWDFEIVERIISHRWWRPVSAHDFTHIDRPSPFPTSADIEGAIVVLPARHHATPEYAHKLNHDIAGIRWSIIMLLGDEESSFPARLLEGFADRIWTMMARPDDPYCHRRLLNGPTPHIQLLDDMPCPDKTLQFFFAGQITHERRQQCAEQLRALPGGRLVETEGFTQGISTHEYIHEMASAKIAPCPSGPIAPDSFRFAEALEAGCVPIADAHAPVPYPDNYWQSVLGDNLPFPVIERWSQLSEIMDRELSDWPRNVNRCSSFWMNYKRQLAYNLHQDICDLSGQSPQPQYLDDQAQCIVFTSYSPWHPSTEHIDRVIASVRFHFPLMEILVLCDGLRPELEQHRDSYGEYLRRLNWKCQHQWRNVLPIVFDHFMHQAAMLREVLADSRYIKTPLLLVIEHDTPLVCTGEYVSWNGITVNTQRPIPWTEIFKTVMDGDANVIRLYHRADGVPKEHEWLMRDKVEVNGIPMIKTLAWSQRPHIATAEYYRRILRDHFTSEARTFIEDRMMTFIQNSDWEAHRVMIYWPSDEEAMRSWHSDSRCGPDGQWGDKFESKLVF